MSPCYSEDTPKGLLSGNKGRNHSYQWTIWSLRKRRVRKEEHWVKLLSSWCSTLREPGSLHCISVIQEHPPPSSVFLAVKKRYILFPWLYASCPFPMEGVITCQNVQKKIQRKFYSIVHILSQSGTILKYRSTRYELGDIKIALQLSLPGEDYTEIQIPAWILTHSFQQLLVSHKELATLWQQLCPATALAVPQSC